MAKYVIRPTGTLSLIQKGMAKVFQENEDGRRVEVGDYKHSMLPGAGKPFRVFWDERKRRYNINIPDARLQFLAKEMKLSDPDSRKMIVSADPGNEYDPFFRHPELMIDVPNGGMAMDDSTVMGEFWWYAIKSAPKHFNINNETDNPLIKNIQEFSVITAGHSESEVSATVKEGKRASQIFWANSTNYKWLLETCRGLDIVVGEGSDIGMMSDAIFIKITI